MKKTIPYIQSIIDNWIKLIEENTIFRIPAANKKSYYLKCCWIVAKYNLLNLAYDFKEQISDAKLYMDFCREHKI